MSSTELPRRSPQWRTSNLDLSFLARGIGLGFAIAAAVGPISLLTIRRTIAHGQVYGLASGAGVALADATYAGIAAFGLTAMTSLLVGGRTVLGVIGGGVIVVLGVRTMVSRPGKAAETTERPGLPAAFASIFGLTMTNPMTILSFAAVFAAAGLAGHGGAEAGLLTLGVFLGSLLWWIVLTAVVARLRSRVTPGALTLINRLSGALLVVFGVVAILTAMASPAGG
jgi:threonine/homoserine/homoserine lactone efflux protein